MAKKRQEIIYKCIAAVMAFGVFVVLLCLSFNYDSGKDTDYRIVCLGDSNMSGTGFEVPIADNLEENLKVRVLNGAFGGTTMAPVASKKTNYNSTLSMYNLAISICNQNFGMQKASIDALQRTDYAGYYKTHLEKLSNTDFDSVDILIIEHGINDYLNGTPIKNGRDAYDVTTFCGALRSSVTMLRNKYPDLRIILVTPAFCAPYDDEGNARLCDEIQYGGGYLLDYVNAEIEVAEEMGLEIINLYEGLGIHGDNFTKYLHDGMHYNDMATKKAADIIAAYLLGEET